MKMDSDQPVLYDADSYDGRLNIEMIPDYGPGTGYGPGPILNAILAAAEPPLFDVIENPPPIAGWSRRPRSTSSNRRQRRRWLTITGIRKDHPGE
jgi:hypothetical protein